jgi:hypothetical protein
LVMVAGLAIVMHGLGDRRGSNGIVWACLGFVAWTRDEGSVKPMRVR